MRQLVYHKWCHQADGFTGTGVGIMMFTGGLWSPGYHRSVFRQRFHYQWDHQGEFCRRDYDQLYPRAGDHHHVCHRFYHGAGFDQTVCHGWEKQKQLGCHIQCGATRGTVEFGVQDITLFPSLAHSDIVEPSVVTICLTISSDKLGVAVQCVARGLSKSWVLPCMTCHKTKPCCPNSV